MAIGTLQPMPTPPVRLPTKSVVVLIYHLMSLLSVSLMILDTLYPIFVWTSGGYVTKLLEKFLDVINIDILWYRQA